MVPPFPNPGSSSSTSSGGSPLGKRVGPIVPKPGRDGRAWWWNVIPIKPNPQGRPDIDDVADWLEVSTGILGQALRP